MKLLLDTHAVLWWATGSGKLGRKAAAAISSPANEPILSAVSAWELAVKLRRETLSLPRHLSADITRHAIGFLLPCPYQASASWIMVS
ncbi:MAG: PIN domain-containing protein [Verrucomicrobiae bacterium]